MDHGRCNVVYLDRRFTNTSLVKKDNLDEYLTTIHPGDRLDTDLLKQNLQAILTTFNEVYVCADGQACLRRLSQLEDPNPQAPTILLIDIPESDESYSSSPLTANLLLRHGIEKNEPVDLYGVHMLSHVCSSIQQRTISRLVIPVSVMPNSEAAYAALTEEPSLWALSKCSPESVRGVKYLDIGAIDALTSPISLDRVQGLLVHAYRIFKEHVKEDTSSLLARRNRKLSWFGIDEERPFAYLREAMVSGLMVGICNPETVNDTFDPIDLKLEEGRAEIVEAAVGQWAFSAHDFTSDELVHAARVILQHALKSEELQQWSIPSDQLTVFVMACRKAYNDFVLYHNFRHVVDVLQATFHFLLRIGLLPPYQVAGSPVATPSNAVAAVLKPFDALSLLVAALGHDVGHPGVNNAFLVALNAPLAQLYNDRSVLEAFHCAAYSQILRRYWPAAFDDTNMRKLMITSILATDMGLHFKYMTEMGVLQEKIAASQSLADGWVPKVTDETRDLVCGLLIKCADISNVARKYACAAQWARVLTDEFANQGAMERELNLPTCLFGGPPDPNDFLKLAESQLGFMNIFARPLFEGISAILPEMRFTLSEMGTNKAIWQERIEQENGRKLSFARGPISPLPRSTASPSESDSIDPREQSSPSLSESDAVKSRSMSKDGSRMPSVAEQHTMDSPVGVQKSRAPGIDDANDTKPNVYRPSTAAQEGMDFAGPASPSKSIGSVLGGSSLAAQGSVDTTNTDNADLAPSTKASSVDGHPHTNQEPVAQTGELGTPRAPGEWTDNMDPKDQAMKMSSVYGPNMHSETGYVLSSKSSSTRDGDDAESTVSESRSGPDLRSSRSQSRLKSLRFWKKKQAE